MYRPLSNPWGHFKGTWQLPDKISKHQAFQIHKPHSGDSRWAKPVRSLLFVRSHGSQFNGSGCLLKGTRRKQSAKHAEEEAAPEKVYFGWVYAI